MPTTEWHSSDQIAAGTPEVSGSAPEGGFGFARRSILYGVLGAYLNAVAYGFAYGRGNHQFELPLANWLRDRTLYPGDPVTRAFAHFPTIFWPVVARASQWLGMEKIVFLFFVLTKVLFFVALARLVLPRVKGELLAAWIICSVALSPSLNELTPFGASNILDSVQTHTSLAIALLLWAGCFLLEGRWILAALICSFTIYVNALLCVYMMFAIAAFLIVDWGRRRTAILVSGLLGAAISLPWLLKSHDSVSHSFPPGYVEAMLAYYPFHIVLRGDEAFDLLSGMGLLAAAGLMVWLARRFGQARDFRLEMLTASFFVPVFCGALFGKFHLTPLLARLQLMRADSFLLLYSILLMQIYGARQLQLQNRAPAATFFFCSTALLLPLSDSLGLVWLLLFAMFFWMDPRKHFDGFWSAWGQMRVARGIALLFLCAGGVVAFLSREDWSLNVIIDLSLPAGCILIYGSPASARNDRLSKVALGMCGAVLLIAMIDTVPRFSSYLNPVVAATPLENDWRAVQEWAKANTPRDTKFLVPTYPGGFREFSERSSWGEWEDGTALHHYPPFTGEYKERMLAVGYSWDKWKKLESNSENYKRLSWERLLTLARQNHLSYIIQFREVAYPVTPIFANQHYAVYEAGL